MSRQHRVLAVLEWDGDEQVSAAAAALAGLLDASPEPFHVAPCVAEEEADDGASPLGQVLTELGPDDVVGAALSAHGEHPLCWDVITRARVPLLVVPRTVTGTVGPISRILLPLDGSATTADVVRPLMLSALEAGVDVLAVHVFDTSTTPAFWDHAAHSHRTWTDEFLRRHQLGDLPLDLRRGRPGVELLDAADGSEVDLVVLGWGQDLEHGHGATVRRALLTATVPVLLVGPRPGTFDEHERGPSSLVPDDPDREG